VGPVTRTGLLIGVGTIAWTFVMGFTGWYKDPVMALVAFLPVVILIEVGLLWWGLRQTAPANEYAQQVMTGTMMAVVAAVVIFIGSYLFTTVFFPNYFEELRTGQEQLLRQQGMADAEIQAQLAAGRVFQTPVWNALFGAIGTVVTGLLASLVIGAFVRRR
jgi:hypothetical protein